MLDALACPNLEAFLDEVTNQRKRTGAVEWSAEGRAQGTSERTTVVAVAAIFFGPSNTRFRGKREYDTPISSKFCSDKGVQNRSSVASWYTTRRVVVPYKVRGQ